jgi:predicted RNase H-like HicB family nuclease
MRYSEQMRAIRSFSIREYIVRALELAVYETDEHGVVLARVPNAQGMFAEGDTVEDARTELADVVEGNLALALQLGLPIPPLPGFEIQEQPR